MVSPFQVGISRSMNTCLDHSLPCRDEDLTETSADDAVIIWDIWRRKKKSTEKHARKTERYFCRTVPEMENMEDVTQMTKVRRFSQRWRSVIESGEMQNRGRRKQGRRRF